MILETGRIVAIEPKGLWVETIQRSACGSCQAQKGCGHSLLAKISGRSAHIWVLLDGRSAQSYRLGDEVHIGVPEEVVARGAIFIYLTPLLTMLLTTTVSHTYKLGDGLSAIAALLGLITGAIVVRLRAHHTRFDTRLQPILVDAQTLVQSVNVGAVE